MQYCTVASMAASLATVVTTAALQVISSGPRRDQSWPSFHICLCVGVDLRTLRLTRTADDRSTLADDEFQYEITAGINNWHARTHGAVSGGATGTFLQPSCLHARLALLSAWQHCKFYVFWLPLLLLWHTVTVQQKLLMSFRRRQQVPLACTVQEWANTFGRSRWAGVNACVWTDVLSL